MPERLRCVDEKEDFLLGGNFADGRGNITLSAEYSSRQGLIKAQRPFASQATSTTGSFPTGTYVTSSANNIQGFLANTRQRLGKKQIALLRGDSGFSDKVGRHLFFSCTHDAVKWCLAEMDMETMSAQDVAPRDEEFGSVDEFDDDMEHSSVPAGDLADDR